MPLSIAGLRRDELLYPRLTRACTHLNRVRPSLCVSRHRREVSRFSAPTVEVKAAEHPAEINGSGTEDEGIEKECGGCLCALVTHEQKKKHLLRVEGPMNRN